MFYLALVAWFIKNSPPVENGWVGKYGVIFLLKSDRLCFNIYSPSTTNSLRLSNLYYPRRAVIILNVRLFCNIFLES
jgi:hypothetical protein